MIALVASTKGGGVNTAVTGAPDTTGATLIVVGATHQVSTSATLTDTYGNSWTALTISNGSGSNAARIYYCINPTVGVGHSFSLADASSAPGVVVAAFSGYGVFDKEATPIDSVDSGNTTLQQNSITPAEDNELIISVLTLAGANTPSIGGAYSIAQHQVFVGGNNYGVDLAYWVQTTATATSPVWTWGSGARSAIVAAAFKSAAAATFQSAWARNANTVILPGIR